MLFYLLLACKDDPSKGPLTSTFPAFHEKVPKNILMISMDTLRRDRMGPYGGDPDIAPFLNSLMNEGVVLKDHHSCSNWTFASVSCMTWGQPPDKIGTMQRLYPTYRVNNPDGPTLAWRLAQVGWHTMLVTSNEWFSETYNSDYGFDDSLRMDSPSTNNAFAQGDTWLSELHSSNPDQPWYLHLHVKEPHPPYNPPSEYLEALKDLPPIKYDLSDKDVQYSIWTLWGDLPEDEREAVLAHLLVRYAGEIRYMDDQMSEWMDWYEKQGWLDDTLVVFWADHGEQFWEHGYQTHAWGLQNEENDGIAFFWAKNIATDTWEGPTTHIDLMPTVLDLMGVQHEALPGMAVGTAPADRVLEGWTAARLGPIQYVLKDGWQLIYHWSGEKHLYNRAVDRTELQDLYAADEPHALALWPLLRPRVEAFQAIIPEYTPYNVGP